MKKNWERKLFYLLTPALMGDPFMPATFGGDTVTASCAFASSANSDTPTAK